MPGTQLGDLTYARSAPSRGGRTLIRMMENASGRRDLLRRAQGYRDEVAAGADFFDVMAARFGVSARIKGGSMSHIPQTGPLIVVANHPFGILDGLLLGHLLSQRRADFKILANSVFTQAPELRDRLLPISFDATRRAQADNIAARKRALGVLEQGGAIGVFPGGTVSTGSAPFAPPTDPAWRNFTARMVAKSRAVVVPVFFHGRTSRLFQLASHLHMNLRLGLLVHEFARQVDQPAQISIGAPLVRANLDPRAGDAKQMMDFLRKATYEQGVGPLKSLETGYDFEDRRGRKRIWQ